ncbi:MAG: V-type ATPase subunit [Candidatus Caldarchaeum sp.]|nr:V-type ATPase subunit [Candidatus Caldarchaeum sp.]
MTIRGDPVYAVTKAYGLRSYLLSPSALEELAYVKNLGDFVDILRPTNYGPFLSQLQKPYTSAGVERALWKSLVDTHFRLIETSLNPGLLQQLFMRYIHFNIKTVLKSKAMGKSSEEILKNIDLYPETLLGIRDQTLKALNAKELSEFLAEYLETPLAATVKTALDIWNERRDFSAIDAMIDKTYLEGLYTAFKKTARAERKLLQFFMFIEIDVKALTTALRAKFWGVTPNQVRNFLPSAMVTLETDFLSGLVEAEDVRKALEKLPENEVFARIRNETNFSKILFNLEESAKRYKLRWASQSFYKTPFRQTVLVAYLVLKENEVRNLATIAKYIEEGVSDVSVIRGSLTLP